MSQENIEIPLTVQDDETSRTIPDVAGLDLLRHKNPIVAAAAGKSALLGSDSEASGKLTPDMLRVDL